MRKKDYTICSTDCAGGWCKGCVPDECCIPPFYIRIWETCLDFF